MRFGCGCSYGHPWTAEAGGDSFEGRAREEYTQGSKKAPFNRTCARWYLFSPPVQSVLTWLQDYKRGAMGPVQELEAPLLACLQAAAEEEDIWEYQQNKQTRRE